MRAKFLKWVWVVMLSVGLALFQASVCFADTKGKMDPDDYLFLTIFRACGVSPGVDVGRWAGLYKGYLKSIGDEALLSQVEGYASLGWGDRAQGVDALFESVKGWLSLSDSYGTESDWYGLPSSPSRQIGKISSMDEVSVLSTPFSEVVYNESGYHYVFSQAFSVGSGTIRQNIYAPDGVEIIAVWSQVYDTSFDYYDGVSVELYMVDSSSATGYSSAPTKYKYSLLYEDGTVKLFDAVIPLTSFRPNIASVMNCPFHVFNSVEDMETYCKTGVVNNTFNSNSCFVTSLGKDGGLDPELQRKGIASIGSTMVLPGSLEEASASVEAFQKPLNQDEFMAILSANGMDTVYNAEYRIEHLRESMAAGSDGEPEWEKYSEEIFYGIPGAVAGFTPLELEGYTYIPELTEPEEREILADESLVICLYYTLDRVPYVVEHYTQKMISGEGGEKWELADTETFQGIPGMLAEYQARNYLGYTFDSSLTEPSDCQVLSDGSLVVRLYYTLNRVSYMVEHYTQRMIPGEGGEKWELADTETFQGFPGTEAEYSVKDYPGYTFDDSLTEPSDCQILLDGSLVVRLYYAQAPFSVLAEPINKAVGSALPVAAVIGSVFSGGLFLLKLYKRISAKA